MSSARAVEHEPRIESRRYGLERSKRGGRERNLPNRRRRLAVRLRYALDVRTGDVNDASRPVDVLARERSPLLRSHTCCGGEADRRAVDLVELRRDLVELVERERLDATRGWGRIRSGQLCGVAIHVAPTAHLPRGTDEAPA
jgi:hypothetical protein